jgi:hypothetical protein
LQPELSSYIVRLYVWLGAGLKCSFVGGSKMANVERVVATAQKIVTCAHRYLKMNESITKQGGYLVVVNHRNEELVLLAKVGQISKELTHKCETLAREKAWRLCNYVDDWTSFESRDVEAKVVVYDYSWPQRPAYTDSWGKWGGAVRGNRYIFSFSGFPELLDEAMMFVLAIKMGELDEEWVIERFGARNKYLVPFLAECRWTE